jgi:HK97 family phage major capsid protein
VAASWGEFLRSIHLSRRGPGAADRQSARKRLADDFGSVEKTALAQSSGVTGGYTVPQALSSALYADLAEASVVRPWAAVVPMASQTEMLPLVDAATVQAAGTSPFFGGILLQWVQEAQTRPETAEPGWRQVELRACELTASALVSRTLLEDAGPALDAYLRRLLARAAAWYEDQAFLAGTGVGQPLGMAKAKAAVPVQRKTVSHFQAEDAQAMLAALLPVSVPRCIWVMHPSVLADLTAFAGWIPNVLVDVAAEEPMGFLRNQVVMRIVWRVGGQPWLASSVTLADAATKASGYVVLS